MTVTQEIINVYASDETASKDKPGNTLYKNGVEVGYTAPAKWWNWLLNKITVDLNSIISDRSPVATEIDNVITYTGASVVQDNTQLSKAVINTTYKECVIHDNETVTEETLDGEVTHYKNKPYVIGHTLFIPSTELL